MATQVSFTGLEKQLKPVNKQMANQIVTMAKNDIRKLIAISEQRVQPQAQTMMQEAKQIADNALSAELHRLTALQAVNKNIRADEIALLEAQKSQTLHHLSQATWRLDSLRVIVSMQES